MLRLRFLAWSTGVSLLAACSGGMAATGADPAAVRPEATTAPVQTWNLSLHLTGGFAGFDRELQLASNGELTASDRKRNLRITAKAASADLDRIAALLDTAKSVQPGRLTACSDCLQYVVEIRSEKPIVWQLNDLNLHQSGLAELVGALTGLMNRALSGQLNP